MASRQGERQPGMVADGADTGAEPGCQTDQRWRRVEEDVQDPMPGPHRRARKRPLAAVVDQGGLQRRLVRVARPEKRLEYVKAVPLIGRLHRLEERVQGVAKRQPRRLALAVGDPGVNRREELA